MGTNFDVIIVGCGMQGLVAAKTFLRISPNLKIRILEVNETIGGVWAKESLYPGLHSNNILGEYDFTDFPTDASFGVKSGQHMPGEMIHNYLTQYAIKFDLIPLIHFQTKVLTASRLHPSGWRLVVSANDQSDLITCSKLILATGLTSQPLPLPRLFSSAKPSNTPILTIRTYPHHTPLLHTSTNIERVLVHGSGKAAHDMVHLLASSGKRVTWLLRPRGHGATYMCRSHIAIPPLGEFKLTTLASMRFMQWLSPCIWGNADGFGWIRWLLHGTSCGRAFVKTCWNKMGSDVLQQSGIMADEITKGLIPRESFLWYGAGTSILNYPDDFYSFVRSGKVELVEKDVKAVEEGGKIVFEDGSDVKVDAVVCSTGWDWAAGVKFLPSESHADLGVPSTEYTPSQKDLWAGLEVRADREILQRFPLLEEGPKPIERDTDDASPMTGWRLWRGTAPPSLPGPPDIVFLGMMLQLQTALRAEITALWAYAYLHGKLAGPLDSIAEPPSPSSQQRINLVPPPIAPPVAEAEEDEEKKLYDTALFNRFGKWRTPYGMGGLRNPDFIFDSLPYFDLLLKDLGLRVWRKGWGWVGEVFGGLYAQREYRGLVEEWMEVQAKGDGLGDKVD